MVATNVKPGEDLSFRIAGTGIFQAESQQSAQGARARRAGGAMGGSQAAANDNRPGGGLGAPIDAPDPLHVYRAYILGAFALVLVMGGAYVVSQSNGAACRDCCRRGAGMRSLPQAADDSPTTGAERAGARPQCAAAGGDEGRVVPTGIDRQQGKISLRSMRKRKPRWMKPSSGRWRVARVRAKSGLEKMLSRH